MDAEPYLNHLAAAHAAVSELTGYYYGLLHFLVTRWRSPGSARTGPLPAWHRDAGRADRAQAAMPPRSTSSSEFIPDT
jgi:hypothetical protein